MKFFNSKFIVGGGTTSAIIATSTNGISWSYFSSPIPTWTTGIYRFFTDGVTLFESVQPEISHHQQMVQLG
jgi:ribulose-5-phosphate 4-epimerase/fuculose-1-phosphate aldolase